MAAPVCNQPTQPVFPTPTVASLPPIPVAHDLASAIQAINAMRQALMTMTGQIPHNNIRPGAHVGNGGGGGGNRQSDQNNNNSNKQNLQDFSEVRPQRVSQTVRVFNPQDQTQFVDVEQITGLVFKNRAGQTLRFSQ